MDEFVGALLWAREFSALALLATFMLGRWSVGKGWRVPWLVCTVRERSVCLVRRHDLVVLADQTWCARCGQRRKRSG